MMYGLLTIVMFRLTLHYLRYLELFGQIKRQKVIYQLVEKGMELLFIITHYIFMVVKQLL